MNPGVLLVDDDADWLRICLKGLPQTRYALEMCDSIDSALRLLSAETFAVVVADICMPGASGGLGGFEVLDRAKALSPDTQVVMITAYVGGFRDIVHEALSRGADNFVKKPVDFQELDDCIVNAIDCWRQRREFRKLLEEKDGSSVYEQKAKSDLEPPETPVWTSEMQKESWERQMGHHCRNLAILGEQAAQYGLVVPLEIVNAMENEKRAILELESKLCGVGRFQGEKT